MHQSNMFKHTINYNFHVEVINSSNKHAENSWRSLR